MLWSKRPKPSILQCCKAQTSGELGLLSWAPGEAHRWCFHWPQSSGGLLGQTPPNVLWFPSHPSQAEMCSLNFFSLALAVAYITAWPFHKNQVLCWDKLLIVSWILNFEIPKYIILKVLVHLDYKLWHFYRNQPGLNLRISRVATAEESVETDGSGKNYEKDVGRSPDSVC